MSNVKNIISKAVTYFTTSMVEYLQHYFSPNTLFSLFSPIFCELRIYYISNNKANNTDDDKKEKQYTNSSKIKNDTPIRAYGLPRKSARFMSIIKTIGFSRLDLNVKWRPFIRKCFPSKIMIYCEKFTRVYNTKHKLITLPIKRQ